MTTVDITELETLPEKAADYLAEHGWTQGRMEDSDGAVCLTGALRAAYRTHGRMYDWRIAAAVFASRGRAEAWNDEAGRTQAEVEAELRDHPIRAQDLETTFGPQWREIVTLARRAAAMTSVDVARINTAAARVHHQQLAEAKESVLRAISAAHRDTMAELADNLISIRNHTFTVALVCRDLIGQRGFTQDHYDTLTYAWRVVVGPIHPDDRELS